MEKDGEQMLKLLIVDDERYDREGLKRQLPWEDFGIIDIETASDGFEAMDLIRSIRPDILITDIKMPWLTGLQLAEEAKKLIPSIKVIFISGYDDFEYVKTALKMDAYEYILKPVDTVELMDAVRNVTDTIRKEAEEEELRESLLRRVDESKPFMRQKLLCDLVFGTARYDELWGTIRSLDIRFGGEAYITVIAEVDDYAEILEKPGDGDIRRLHDRINAVIDNLSSTLCQIQPIHINDARYVLLLSFGQTGSSGAQASCAQVSGAQLSGVQTLEALTSEAARIARDMLEMAAQICGISMTAAVGLPVVKPEDVHKSYTHGCDVLSRKMFSGKGTVLTDRGSFQEGMEENGIFAEIDQELVKCIRNLDMDRAHHLLDYLFDSIRTKQGVGARYVQDLCINIISKMQVALFEMNETVENIFGPGVVLWEKLMKFETILDIRQWMKNVFKAVIEYLAVKRERGSRKVIESVIRYIEENYHREITLKEIAAEFFYSPNYLGQIFKEETGQGFNEFLTEYRMKTARELLKDGALKIYEVAEMVSYRKVAAFISQFKKYYGVTPKEYRDRC